jgi:crotonobetainyl-CoA:carnitine CoA-transferase CaiB-like acyl-CoA transferase
MRLDGVRVLDLSRLLPGPYATQLLCDLGADVVKIEAPETGDYARHQPPLTDRGQGRLFEAVNRGKRSVGVDLKRARGRELFYRLAEDADVVFEQFRPGVAGRLGIDYEAVRERNPDVVYCSLSGYGQTGPYADRVGHDLNYVGVGGLLDMTRESPDEAPRIPGYPIADMAGGLFAAFTIVGALASRALGNSEGEYIDVAMTDVVVSLSQAVTADALAGEDPRPGDTPLSGGLPWYDVYEAADGRSLTLAALEPRFWAAFCEAVDRPDLRAVHGTDDPAELTALREELAALFAARARDDWLDQLADTEAMVGPVHTPRELLEDPQIDARGLVERPDDGAPRIGFPARFSGGRAAADGPAPALGEHTDELLGAIGLDDSALEDLREAGVVA